MVRSMDIQTSLGLKQMFEGPVTYVNVTCEALARVFYSDTCLQQLISSHSLIIDWCSICKLSVRNHELAKCMATHLSKEMGLSTVSPFNPGLQPSTINEWLHKERSNNFSEKTIWSHEGIGSCKRAPCSKLYCVIFHWKQIDWNA